MKNKLFFFTDWEYNAIGQTATPSTGLRSDRCRLFAVVSPVPGNTNLQQFQKYVPAATWRRRGLRHHDLRSLRASQPDRIRRMALAVNVPVGRRRLYWPQLPELSEHRQLVRLQHLREGPVSRPLGVHQEHRPSTRLRSCRLLDDVYPTDLLVDHYERVSQLLAPT